jgi:hypothetical protein
MNANKIHFSTHTKAIFVIGLGLLAAAFIFALADIRLNGIHIFPTVQQMEHGRKVDAIFNLLLVLGFVAEFLALVCFVMDNPQPKRAPTMRVRL